MSSPTTGPIIDVDRLVADLQERVAAHTAAGEYDEGLLRTPFALLSDTPVGTIVLRPEAAYSSKPVVGPVITRIKRALIASLFHFLNDAVSQANVALAASRRAVEREENAREAVEAQLLGATRELSDALDRIAVLERDLDEQRATIEPLAHLEIEARLVQLERSGRPERTEPSEVRPVDSQLIALAARTTEPHVEGRLDEYIAQIGAGPILDLAPGDGGLLTRCEAAGIVARGIDPHSADPLAELAAIEPGSLHGIVAIGLCDRLDLSGIATFADLAATRLAKDGTLVVEIANPLTMAGRARRLRNPTLAPAVHPETLAWAFRLAGLDAVETRYLGAFTSDEEIPLEDPAADDLGWRYNAIAHRVNRALVGEPIVAIFARRAATT